MHSLVRSFQDCGFAAWICLLMALVGVLTAGVGVILGAVKQRTGANVLGAVGGALGVLAVATGFGGRIHAESVVAEVLTSSGIDPTQKERIRAEGMKEASQCVTIGIGTAMLPFLLGAVAVALGMSVQKQP